jgi:hypothetical protein
MPSPARPHRLRTPLGSIPGAPAAMYGAHAQIMSL